MGNAQQTPSQTRLDPDSVLGMYLASIDAWKKDCDAFVQASRGQQGQPSATLNRGVAYENTSAQLQKTGEDFFRRFVELQIEICRFFGKRWEQYLDLPSDITHCQSAADIAQLQSAFLTKMAADYGIEARQFAQDFQTLLSNWMAPQPMSIDTQRPTHH
jgi:hypothetical protein